MNLFVYGTLLIPEIWRRISGADSLESRAATLEGYEVRRVAGEAFPGIVVGEAGGEPVAGRVFFGLGAAEMRLLDAYEDSFYERIKVMPLVDGLGPVAAQAYVVPQDLAASILSAEPWSLAWFERHALADFRARLFGG